MSLVPSLLQAIVKVDGEAMVMHAGDKPYVVSPTGQVELASRGLTLSAVNGIVVQLLPIESLSALEEFGAISYELPFRAEFPNEYFTVVAARGGDDVWVEIRRRRIPDDDPVPEDLFAQTLPPPDAVSVASAPVVEPLPVPAVAASAPPPAVASVAGPEREPVVACAAAPLTVPNTNAIALDEAERDVEIALDDDDLWLPDEAQLFGQPVSALTDSALADGEEHAIDLDADLDSDDDIAVPAPMADVPVPAVVRVAAAIAAQPSSVHETAAPLARLVESVAVPIVVAPTMAVSQGYIAPLVTSPIAEARFAPDETCESPVAEAVACEERHFEAVAESEAHIAPELVEAVASAELAEAESHVEPPIAETVALEEAQLEAVAEPETHVAAVAEPELQATPEVAEAVAAAEHAALESHIELAVAEAVASSESDVEPVAEPAAEDVEAPRLLSRAAEREHPAPSQPAVVLPISRSPIRGDQPPPIIPDVTGPGLDRLLRLASARGAATLYLSSESRPSVRVDGELQILDAEPVHSARDVQSLMLTLMPERNHEALRTGALTEWICDIDGVGRVRCMSFRDHLGPGGVFRLMPTRSVSVEQLGLPRHVRSLAIEPEGLILVTGPRSSGKRTLMAAFVDLMNRTRRDHIITIEREINIVHEGGQSFISQREVRGNDDEMAAAARAALREDPDVLVIEELHTAALMNVALEAAASGHLVVGGFSAHTATGAIDRIIDLYAPEQRRHVQFALADALRGVIVQVLLRKIGGGRLPAREVLLNTPAVSTAIVEGKTSQLAMAIEGGRRHGMMPLNDALIGLVQSGAVDAREAYRQSPDRPGFLAALKRHGQDTSFVERLA